MAGRKITQLPTLTTPEATDKLVIVDVSDTSESPQGTSKQIAVGDLNAIPLSGTTEMEAAEITHTSTGKTASVGFVDGSVYLTAIGADGISTIAAGEDTTTIQYDSLVSGYSSLVTLSDGVFQLDINGVVIQGEWDGANQKLAFFGATPVAKAGAIADATNGATSITQLNLLLAALRSYGLIAE